MCEQNTGIKKYKLHKQQVNRDLLKRRDHPHMLDRLNYDP